MPRDLGVGQYRVLRPFEVRRVTNKGEQAQWAYKIGLEASDMMTSQLGRKGGGQEKEKERKRRGKGRRNESDEANDDLGLDQDHLEKKEKDWLQEAKESYYLRRQQAAGEFHDEYDGDGDDEV